MTVETYLLFVAPILLLGFGFTVVVLNDFTNWRRDAQWQLQKIRRRDDPRFRR